MDLKYPILTLFSLILMGQLGAQELSTTSQKPVLSSSTVVSSGNTIDASSSSSIAQMTTCLIDGAIEMTNLVTNLPTDLTNCYVGDSIEICFQVNQYTQTNNNWLQAIVPTFGDCFYVERDPITQEPLRYTVPPPVSANGQWEWFPDLSVLYNDIPDGSLAGGDPVGEGWFFVGEIPSGAPCFDPTDPNCTWGDQIAGANGATFEICIIVELTCSDPGPDFLPCDVDFKTYSDGEVGAYQFPACQNDGLIQDLLFFACCEDPEIINDSYDLSVCSGESADILIVSDMDPETTYEWVATPEAFGATSGSGALIDDVYFNDTGSPVTVEYLVTPTCALGCVGREKLFTVTIWPEVEARIDGSSTICEGDCAFLSAETGSDQAPFTYEWSTGSTDQGFVACEPAGFYFYSVTITDRNGCQDEAIFWLEVLPIPDVSIDVVGPTILCPGESTQLVASASGSFGSYTFNWDGGQVGNTLVVDQPGTYTVMAIDVFGCSSFPVSVTIEGVNIDLSVVSSGPQLVCAQGGGNIVDLVASVNGGSGNYTYQWSNGGDAESITVDQPGSYAVAVTDNLHGCFADAVIEVEGADPPTLTIDAGPDSEICANDPTAGITLSAITAGGSGDFYYNWTDGTEGSSTFVQQSESIGLNIVDQQTGCLVTASPVDLTIHPPIGITIIPDIGTELCATQPGDGLSFSAVPDGGSGNYSYNWTTGDVGETAFVQSSGSLALTIVDEQSGCVTESEPLEITIHDPLEVSFATDTGLELCAAGPGDGINVSAVPGGGSGDYQFNWGNGESGSDVLLQSSGSMDVTVVDQQTGCSTSAESPEVTIHPPLELTILADAPTALCANSDEWPIQLTAAAISGSGDYAFSWSTGSEQADIQIEDGGEYLLQIVDQQTGCEASASETITSLALPEINLSGPTETCLSAEQICLDAQPLGGSWSNPNINGYCLDLGTLSPGMQLLNYTYTDLNGCSATATFQLETYAPPSLPQVTCSTTTASVAFDWAETDGYTYLVNGDPWTGGSYQVSSLSPEQEVTIEIAVATDGPCLPVAQAYQCATEACPPVSVALTTDLSQAFCSNDLPGQPIQLSFEIFGDDSQLGSGSWSGPGLIDTELGILDLVQADLGVGEFNYTYTYQLSNCTYTADQALRIAAPPEVDAGEDQIVGCDFEQIDLLGIASSLSQIVWLDATGQQIGSSVAQSVSETGLYQLRATDPITNCYAVDEVVVTITEDQPTDVEIMIEPETCYGDGDSQVEILDVIGGTAPYTFQFDTQLPDTEGRWIGLEASTYSLSIVDDLGCSLQTSIDLPARRPLAFELEEEVELIAGEAHYVGLEFPIDEQVSARWYPDIAVECIDPACLEVMLSPYLSQVYTVEVVDDRACMATDNISILVKDGSAVYLPNAFSPNEDGQNDEFMIYPLQEEVRVSQRTIYDRWGNLVSGGDTSAQSGQHYIWDGRKSGQMCNVGVYIYQVELVMPDGDKEIVTGEVTLLR